MSFAESEPNTPVYSTETRPESEDLLEGAATENGMGRLALLHTPLAPSYEELGDRIEHLLAERAQLRLGGGALQRARFKHLTGDISEHTVLSLLVRDGERSPFIAYPATRNEDLGEVLEDGTHTGIDIHAIPVANPTLDVHLQVKTAHMHGTRYTDDVIVVNLKKIAGMFPLGHMTLPRTIVRDADGVRTFREYRHINSATRRLEKTINDGLDRR